MSSVSKGLYFLTLPVVSVMRVIYTSKGMSKKFGVCVIHQVRVIYRKIRQFTFLNLLSPKNTGETTLSYQDPSPYSTVPDPKASHRRLLLHYSTFSSPIFCRIKGSRRQLSRFLNYATERQSTELCFCSLQWQQVIFCTKATISVVWSTQPTVQWVQRNLPRDYVTLVCI